jgi:hypothetical protein
MLTNREVNKSLAPVYAEMIAHDLVAAFADRLPIKGSWDIELYRIVYHSNTEAMSLCITPTQFTEAVTDAALNSPCRIGVGGDIFQVIVATYLSFAIHCIQLKVDSWCDAGLPANNGALIEYLNSSWATIDVDPASSPFKEHSPPKPAPRSPEVRVCPVQARREQRAREAAAAAATSDAAYSDLLREADAHLRNKRFKAKKQAARKAAAARKQAAKPPPYGGPSRDHAASDDDEPAPPPPY